MVRDAATLDFLTLRLASAPSAVEREVLIPVRGDDQVALCCPLCAAASSVDYHIILQGHRALVCPGCSTPSLIADMIIAGNPGVARQFQTALDMT